MISTVLWYDAIALVCVHGDLLISCSPEEKFVFWDQVVHRIQLMK